MSSKSPIHQPIHTATDAIFHATARGNVDTVELPIKNALFAPELHENLLSVGQLARSGFDTLFQGENVYIGTGFQQPKRYAARGSRTNGAYHLTLTKGFPQANSFSALQVEPETPRAMATTVSIDHAHLALGHLNEKSIRHLANNNLLPNLLLDPADQLNPCSGCLEGKARKGSPPASSSTTSTIGDLITMDLVGPIEPISVCGSSFILIATEVHTHTTYSWPLRTKGAAFGVLQTFFNIFEKQHGPIKTIRTDNGGEFTSQKLKSLCDTLGIQRQTTIRYSSHQNGISERANLTILNGIRASLVSSGLPWTYWSYALNHVTFSRNLSPTTALKDSIPVLSLTGKAPDYTFLHPFGATCYAVTEPIDRRKAGSLKIAPRAVKCRLLGYCTDKKGYLLLQETGKIIEATPHNVTFIAAPPMTSNPPKTPDPQDRPILFPSTSIQNPSPHPPAATNNADPFIDDTISGTNIDDVDQSFHSAEDDISDTDPSSDHIQPPTPHPPTQPPEPATAPFVITDNKRFGKYKYEPTTAPAKYDVTIPPISSKRHRPPVDYTGAFLATDPSPRCSACIAGHIAAEDIITPTAAEFMFLASLKWYKESPRSFQKHAHSSEEHAHSSEEHANSSEEHANSRHKQEHANSSTPLNSNLPSPPTHHPSSPNSQYQEHAHCSKEQANSSKEQANSSTKQEHANSSSFRTKSHDPKLPKNHYDINHRPDASQWIQAEQEEIAQLLAMGTWSNPEPLPPGRQAIKNKWVYRLKTDAHGNVTRYKARLCACGYSQKAGIDYKEVYAPVFRMESSRIFLQIVASREMHFAQMDVTAAFLNGPLEERIYMQQIPGYEDLNNADYVLQLLRNLYGLKQSPRVWHQTIHPFLVELGFSSLQADPCIYTKGSAKSGNLQLISLYVDNLGLAVDQESDLLWLKGQLHAKFKMTDEPDNLFLNLRLTRTSNGFQLCQEQAILNLLDSTNMAACTPLSVPIDSVNVSIADCPQPNSPEWLEMQLVPYRETIGSLTQLCRLTRPDISFAVAVASRYLANPGKSHWNLVKRILRYLKGTCDWTFHIAPSQSFDHLLTQSSSLSPLNGHSKFFGFCDADLAGQRESAHSTSGYGFFIGGSLVSWMSKSQSTVATSSTFAEYIAAYHASTECIWTRSFLSELDLLPPGPTPILCDNQAAISLASNHMVNPRSKHIDIKFHYLREQAARGHLVLLHCPTAHNVADIWTKPLPPKRFSILRSSLGVHPPSFQS